MNNMVTLSFWLDLCEFVWKDGFRRGWIFKDCGDIWIRLLRGEVKELGYIGSYYVSAGNTLK
jgi:hypothetical protein